MWYGKLSIIIYVFSLALLFGGYYANQVFNDPSLSTPNTTYSYLSSLMNSKYRFSQSPNAALILGDFITTFQLIGSLMSGDLLSQSQTMLQGSGFGGYGEAVMLLQGLLFDSATFFLLLYIISFRSI